MIKKFNPKLNKTFILGRGLNISNTDKPIVETINLNKKKLIDQSKASISLPLEHQKFLKSLINKTGKGFKKI